MDQGLLCLRPAGFTNSVDLTRREMRDYGFYLTASDGRLEHELHRSDPNVLVERFRRWFVPCNPIARHPMMVERIVFAHPGFRVDEPRQFLPVRGLPARDV